MRVRVRSAGEGQRRPACVGDAVPRPGLTGCLSVACRAGEGRGSEGEACHLPLLTPPLPRISCCLHKAGGRPARDSENPVWCQLFGPRILTPPTESSRSSSPHHGNGEESLDVAVLTSSSPACLLLIFLLLLLLLFLLPCLRSPPPSSPPFSPPPLPVLSSSSFSFPAYPPLLRLLPCLPSSCVCSMCVHALVTLKTTHLCRATQSMRWNFSPGPDRRPQ